MKRKVIVISMIGIAVIAAVFVYYAFFKRGEMRIAVFGPFSSKRFLSHKNTYYEALHMYTLDHPNTRLKPIEVDISYKASKDDIAVKIKSIREKGVGLIIAPYSSPITSMIAEIASRYGIPVLSPFSRYAEPSENLFSLTPSLRDFAKIASEFAKNFKSALIISDGNYRIDREMSEKMIEELKKRGLRVEVAENLKGPVPEDTLLVVVKGFPSYISGDFKYMEKSRSRVLLVTTYINHFQSFYGKRMNGMYAVDHTFYHTERGREFVEKYMRKFQKLPSPGVVAMYDALSLSEELYERFGRFPKIDQIRSLKYFDGVMGRVNLDSDDLSYLLTISVFESSDGICGRISVRE